MTLKISRERCVEIAKDVASKRATMHSYYAEPFKPHQWVIDAMMEAAHEAASECDMPTMKWHGWKCSKGYKHKGPCEPTPSSSQPQPVAQGEAVDEKLRKILTVGGYRTDGDSATLMERVHFMALENRDLALMQETLIKRHEESNATPTIPTGHRVVPVEHAKDIDRLRWLLEDHADKETRDKRNELLRRMRVMSYFSAITDIDNAMLAAAPDAGGV